MARPRLADYFRNPDDTPSPRTSPDTQKAFQQYLEHRIDMIANYIKSRWGVKPNGRLDVVSITPVPAPWGEHKVLTVIVSRNVRNANDIVRGVIKFAMGAFPTPDFASISVQSGEHLGYEVDIITVEARPATVLFLD